MARRRSSITNRLTKIRGITAIEKDLFKRIGETIDGAMNNRAPTNPGISPLRKTVRKRQLPPPKDLAVQASTQNALVTWGPVNSPVLNFYEVQITNRDTNLAVLKLAFSSRIYIGDSGNFEVKVRSVSRNGDASPYSEGITFEISDDVLFLEGNKHETTLTNELIAEDIFTPAAYRVFCWGAFNLNDLAVPGINPTPFLEFSQETLYPIFSRLGMFPESETYVNADDAVATFANTVRPATRSATQFWESPQAAMFKPYPVLSTDKFVDQQSPFNVFLDNRNDGVGLSMTLFSIPATITEVEEEFDFQEKSLQLGTDSLSTTIQNASVDSPLGWNPTGRHTNIMWIKLPDVLDTNVITPIDWGSNVPGDRTSIYRFRILKSTDPSSATFFIHQNNAGPNTTFRWFGSDIEDFIQSQLGNWTVWILTYNLTGDPALFANRATLRINNTNFGIATTATEVGGGVDELFLTDLTTVSASSSVNFSSKFFYTAIWNDLLSDDAIQVIVDNPQAQLNLPFSPSYRDPITEISYASNLLHWWRFGLDELDIGFDSGNFSPLIDYNDEGLVDQDDLVADVPTAAGEA